MFADTPNEGIYRSGQHIVALIKDIIVATGYTRHHIIIIIYTFTKMQALSNLRIVW